MLCSQARGAKLIRGPGTSTVPRTTRFQRGGVLTRCNVTRETEVSGLNRPVASLRILTFQLPHTQRVGPIRDVTTQGRGEVLLNDSLGPLLAGLPSHVISIFGLPGSKLPS